MSSATSATEIRPIEAESVRRIVAGQAVTDLASAVKELVDNALDAGSKSINSKFKVSSHITGIQRIYSIP
jgi:DNA mismatch repair protein PMS2